MNIQNSSSIPLSEYRQMGQGASGDFKLRGKITTQGLALKPVTDATKVVTSSKIKMANREMRQDLMNAMRQELESAGVPMTSVNNFMVFAGKTLGIKYAGKAEGNPGKVEVGPQIAKGDPEKAGEDLESKTLNQLLDGIDAIKAKHGCESLPKVTQAQADVVNNPDNCVTLRRIMGNRDGITLKPLGRAPGNEFLVCEASVAGKDEPTVVVITNNGEAVTAEDFDGLYYQVATDFDKPMDLIRDYTADQIKGMRIVYERISDGAEAFKTSHPKEYEKNGEEYLNQIRLNALVNLPNWAKHVPSNGWQDGVMPDYYWRMHFAGDAPTSDELAKCKTAGERETFISGRYFEGYRGQLMKNNSIFSTRRPDSKAPSFTYGFTNKEDGSGGVKAVLKKPQQKSVGNKPRQKSVGSKPNQKSVGNIKNNKGLKG